MHDAEEQAAAHAHEANQEEDEWAMLRAGQAAAAAIIAADEHAANVRKNNTEDEDSDVHSSSHSKALEAIKLARSTVASGKEEGVELASEGDHGEIAGVDESAAETVTTDTMYNDTHENGAQAPADLEVGTCCSKTFTKYRSDSLYLCS